jgi:hypothetical protein
MTIEQQVFTTLSEVMSDLTLMEIWASRYDNAVVVQNGKNQRLYFYPPILFKSARVELAVLKKDNDYRVYDTIAIITLHDRQKAKEMYNNLREECAKRRKQDIEGELTNFVVDKA